MLRDIYRQQLSSSGKVFYDEIAKQIVSGHYDKFVLTKSGLLYASGIKQAMTDAMEAYAALIADVPEYFWLRHNCRCSGGPGSITLCAGNCFDGNVSVGVRQLLSGISELTEGLFGNEYEIVLRLYLRFIEKFRYYNSGNTLIDHTALGLIIGENHSAVCEGIADLFKCCLDYLEIDNCCVSSETHKWNMVYFSELDTCAHFDLCCDISKQGDYEPPLMKGFGMTDKDVSIIDSHLVEREIFPRCDNDRINFYYWKNIAFCNQMGFYQSIKDGMNSDEEIVRARWIDSSPENTLPIATQAIKNSSYLGSYRVVYSDSYLMVIKNKAEKASTPSWEPDKIPVLLPGPGCKKGHSVVALSVAKNPQKIRVRFSNGYSQVIDIPVAKSLKYVVEY